MKKQKTGTISFLNGPNLNLLGHREPEKYGTDTLDDIVRQAVKKARAHAFILQPFQSNHEGVLIDKIQEIAFRRKDGWLDGIVLNAGGLTHTSVSLRDAVDFARSKGVPTVEVHLSDIHKRETFRHVSLLTGVCIDQVCGLKSESYMIGLDKLILHLSS